ncbi:hypothetical protein EIP75_18770 [Aquabacterium soli]|uniref:Uncharacterized protein n=1 Tax=Aquabacterium soli TaxID=2493092 RepID=A0A3R8T308_9BURK|nr:hypothetical protein [Aquabacterium soli]RRS02813.1 hypothetical protein EIP75_18770 [Aquabacterium soli]
MPDTSKSVHGKKGCWSPRQCLRATILSSALSGVALAMAGELWIQGAGEALVLFMLFVAACFYVVAETGFGERMLEMVRQQTP